MAKFGRPDGIEEHHVVAVAAGPACGHDFVMQRFVGDELKVDFDIRVLFFEVGGHGTNVIFAVRRLGHKQGVNLGGRRRTPADDQHSQQTGFNPKCTVVVHVALRGTEKRDMIY